MIVPALFRLDILAALFARQFSWSVDLAHVSDFVISCSIPVLHDMCQVDGMHMVATFGAIGKIEVKSSAQIIGLATYEPGCRMGACDRSRRVPMCRQRPTE